MASNVLGRPIKDLGNRGRISYNDLQPGLKVVEHRLHKRIVTKFKIQVVQSQWTTAYNTQLVIMRSMDGINAGRGTYLF